MIPITSAVDECMWVFFKNGFVTQQGLVISCFSKIWTRTSAMKHNCDCNSLEIKQKTATVHITVLSSVPCSPARAIDPPWRSNSMWSINAIWRHRSWSTWVQVMACCLTTPSHYLNQFWFVAKVFYSIRLRANSQEVLMNLIHNMCSEIAQRLHF